MRSGNDGTNTRSPTTMRNCKSFMKIKVRNISTEFSRLCNTNQSVEICAINVDLTARFMDQCADITDSTFEYSVSTWIGNHERRQICLMFGNLRLDIGSAYIAMLIAFNDDDFHAGHDSTGSICTVSTRWDETDGAILIAAGIVIITNSQQTSELSLASSIWLQGDCVITSDGDQPLRELINKLSRTNALICRSKWVQL